MSLLTIAQDVADQTKGPRPGSVVGSVDPTSQNLLRIINKVGRMLALAYPWLCLRQEHVFTSVAGSEQTNAMPSDFSRFVPETFWNRSETILISGPVSSVEWNSLKAEYYDYINRKFIHRGAKIFVLPELGAGDTLAFEYVSTNWCADDLGTGKSGFSSDDDVGILDEELLTLAAVAQWLMAEGLPSGGAVSDFKSYFEDLTTAEEASSGIAVTADLFATGSRHFDGQPNPSLSGHGLDYL